MNSVSFRGAALLIAGLAALSAAVMTSHFRFVAVIGGITCFLLGATAFSQAGHLATSLQRFRNQSARILVWGAPVPTAGGSNIEIDSVRALGAGLLIYLRPSPRGPRNLLKVAQPGPGRFADGRFEIDKARYVSWAGKRLVPVTSHPALEIQTTS